MWSEAAEVHSNSFTVTPANAELNARLI